MTGPGGGDRPDGVDGAAAAFEAYFLRRVLSEVKGTEGLGGGGFAGGVFKDMLDDALADAMSDAGGVGLAEMVAAELERSGGQPAARPASDAADAITALKLGAGRPTR
jgi:Rod binding domain-containing protein